MPTTRFSMPPSGLIYVNDVLERCQELIRYGIWAGIQVADLSQWMSNFESDDEKYFAACILDGMIYRSEDQTVTLIKQLLQRTLPDLERLNPMPISPIRDWQVFLSQTRSRDCPVRLIAAVPPGDDPTNSASTIARLMRREAAINQHLIIYPNQIDTSLEQGCHVFLFIDDFLGTGEQFQSVYEANDLRTKVRGCYNAYLPLVAHQDGVDYLRQEFPELFVRTVELLDSSYGIFNAASNFFNDGHNSPQAALQFYDELLRRKQLVMRRDIRRGRGRLELAYMFSHGAPNNCLPILWWGNSPNWKRLIIR